MQTLIKTVVLTVLVSFCAPISIGAAAEAVAGNRSLSADKAGPGAASRKKHPKAAAKRDAKKADKVTSHEL